MALHEQSVGATDEWYTPAYVFEAMNVRFDSDPCPALFHQSPARSWCFLRGRWEGFVWMNPPFGGRNGIVPWLEKFFAHGDGVCLTPDRTSAPWWQRFARQADAILFISPKIKFLGPDGPGGSPAQGTTLMAAGPRGVQALRNARAAQLGLLLSHAA